MSWCDRDNLGNRKCFVLPLSNSLLKTTKKINLFILITFIQILILFFRIPAQSKQPAGFSSFRPISARVFERLFHKCSECTFERRINKNLVPFAFL